MHLTRTVLCGALVWMLGAGIPLWAQAADQPAAEAPAAEAPVKAKQKKKKAEQSKQAKPQTDMAKKKKKKAQPEEAAPAAEVKPAPTEVKLLVEVKQAPEPPKPQPVVAEQKPVEKTAEEKQAEERTAILESHEMREALAWTEASLAVRAGDGAKMVDGFKHEISAMSAEELRNFLSEYQLTRTEILRQQQEFQLQRNNTFDKAFAYHLQSQQLAMQSAANRKAATFKQFDSGQDRYNNGFHGYKGPPGPLIRGGFYGIGLGFW